MLLLKLHLQGRPTELVQVGRQDRDSVGCENTCSWWRKGGAGPAGIPNPPTPNPASTQPDPTQTPPTNIMPPGYVSAIRSDVLQQLAASGAVDPPAPGGAPRQPPSWAQLQAEVAKREERVAGGRQLPRNDVDGLWPFLFVGGWRAAAGGREGGGGGGRRRQRVFSCFSYWVVGPEA
jgi:hypothetical protein